MVIATIIVLSNLAAVGVEFFYLTLGRVFDSTWLSGLDDDKTVNIVTTLVFLAIATWVSMRGITTSERIQYVLVAFQMVVLITFAVVALIQVGDGGAPAHLQFDIDWFNRSPVRGSRRSPSASRVRSSRSGSGTPV